MGSQKPDVAGLQALLQPVGAKLQAAVTLTDGRRTPAFNNYKVAADALQALSWVAYTGPSCGTVLAPSAPAIGTASRRVQAWPRHRDREAWMLSCGSAQAMRDYHCCLHLAMRNRPSASPRCDVAMHYPMSHLPDMTF